MAKFLNILAASVGSGLVLGASIRLGEALGGKLKTGMPEPTARRFSPAPLLSRLDCLEDKMSRAFSPDPELESIVAGVIARMDRQQADVDSMRQQVAEAARALDSVGDTANHLRSDLQKELSRNLDERLAAVEARVRLRMEAARGDTLDAMVNAMENRATPRIVRMESEIAGQNAAVSELRECALQSERSVQRLIGVLERMMRPAQDNSAQPRQGGPKGLAGNYNSPAPVSSLAGSPQDETLPTGVPARMPVSFAVLNPIS
jgi:hypothetical protein